MGTPRCPRAGSDPNGWLRSSNEAEQYLSGHPADDVQFSPGEWKQRLDELRLWVENLERPLPAEARQRQKLAKAAKVLLDALPELDFFAPNWLIGVRDGGGESAHKVWTRTWLELVAGNEAVAANPWYSALARIGEPSSRFAFAVHSGCIHFEWPLLSARQLLAAAVCWGHEAPVPGDTTRAEERREKLIASWEKTHGRGRDLAQATWRERWDRMYGASGAWLSGRAAVKFDA